MRLLTSIVSASNHTKCVSLSNQKCMTQSALINPNEYSQELCYYPFSNNLDGCAMSWNTLDNLSSKLCVQNEPENLNLHVFNMITETNETKTLTKLNVSLIVRNLTQIKSETTITVGVSVKIKKNIIYAKKIYIWNPAN